MIKRWTESTDEPTLNKLELALYRAAQKAATFFANYYYKLLILDPNSTPYYTHLISSIKSPERDMVWQAPDAIHYQAGIDNILCQDMEFAIKVDDDFGNVITELNYIIDQVCIHLYLGNLILFIISYRFLMYHSLNRFMLTKRTRNSLSI
jgi:hypothetical protein